jgi:hypothetical protein
MQVEIFMFSKEELRQLLQDVLREAQSAVYMSPPLPLVEIRFPKEDTEEEKGPEVQVLFEPGKRTFKI